MIESGAYKKPIIVEIEAPALLWPVAEITIKNSIRSVPKRYKAIKRARASNSDLSAFKGKLRTDSCEVNKTKEIFKVLTFL